MRFYINHMYLKKYSISRKSYARTLFFLMWVIRFVIIQLLKSIFYKNAAKKSVARNLQKTCPCSYFEIWMGKFSGNFVQRTSLFINNGLYFLLQPNPLSEISKNPLKEKRA